MHNLIHSPLDLSMFLLGILLCIIFGAALLFIVAAICVFSYFAAKTYLMGLFTRSERIDPVSPIKK